MPPFAVRAIVLSLSFLSLTCPALYAASADHVLMIGQEQQAIDGYVKNIGLPDGFMIYTSIQEANGLDSPSDKGAGIQYAQDLIARYPQVKIIQAGLYMNGALTDILQGRYDRNIDKLAQWIKQSGKKVYLRIGYEFDLPDNHYDPQQYKKAFIYIVDRFKKLKVSNVIYVWHSAAVPNKVTDFESWYPGDGYVDYFAISYFNDQQEKPAESFFELAKAHHKPVMIAESTPTGMYTMNGKRSWYNKYAAFIRKHSIKVICYINCNWDQYPMYKDGSWGDSRVEKNAEIKKWWLDFIGEFKK